TQTWMSSVMCNGQPLAAEANGEVYMPADIVSQTVSNGGTCVITTAPGEMAEIYSVAGVITINGDVATNDNPAILNGAQQHTGTITIVYAPNNASNGMRVVLSR
ncbi:hypothetical protein KC685_01955, partial [Candidatus Dojkabacteria bacterium]|nr:hypothetical protein [Candidatus Dojkabacteria bacterium]